MVVRNWFKNREYRFSDAISENNGILTSGLILASSEFITILQMYSTPLFIPIIKLFKNDIERITKYYTNHPEEDCNTIEKILTSDLQYTNCKHNELECKHMTRIILTLTHVYIFMEKVFSILIEKPNVTLAAVLQEAYSTTLYNRHNGVERALFHNAMYACPTRSTFFSKLSNDDPYNIVVNDARIYFKEMNIIKDKLIHLLKTTYSYII